MHSFGNERKHDFPKVVIVVVMERSILIDFASQRLRVLSCGAPASYRACSKDVYLRSGQPQL